MAGTDAAIAALLAFLRARPEFAALEHKESRASKMPFLRMKVRVKKEIVTMGVEDIDPNRIVGTYVDPKDWNALITDPDTIVIDTRNDYETAIGIFKARRRPEHPRPSASFPTGCARIPACTTSRRSPCTAQRHPLRKATAFMKQEGFEEVYHLKGGILKYLEEVPEDESLWEGECFVFDERVLGDPRPQGRRNTASVTPAATPKRRKTSPPRATRKASPALNAMMQYEADVAKDPGIATASGSTRSCWARKRGKEHLGG